MTSIALCNFTSDFDFGVSAKHLRAYLTPVPLFIHSLGNMNLQFKIQILLQTMIMIISLH